jgi:hypothetical protein
MVETVKGGAMKARVMTVQSLTRKEEAVKNRFLIGVRNLRPVIRTLGRNSVKTRRRVGFIFALAAVVVASALAAPASAGVPYATGAYGDVYPGTATCREDGIHVDAPIIKPSIAVRGADLGGGQWTAFGSVLERYDQTRGWVDVYKSEPYFHYANWSNVYGDIDTSPFYYVHPTDGWQRTNQGQFIRMAVRDSQGRWIPMTGRTGYFRYSLVVFWFDASNRVIGERRMVGNGMADERGVDTRLWRYWDYCYYG